MESTNVLGGIITAVSAAIIGIIVAVDKCIGNKACHSKCCLGELDFESTVDDESSTKEN